MKLPRRGLASGEGGATAVEFSLVVPVVLLLVLATFDFARAVNAYVVVSNASREGARYAVVHPGARPGDIATAVASRAVPLAPSLLTVNAWYYDGSTFQPWPIGGVTATADGFPVRVEVSYPWAAATTLVGGFFSAGSGSSTFSASSTMVLP